MGENDDIQFWSHTQDKEEIKWQKMQVSGDNKRLWFDKHNKI